MGMGSVVLGGGGGGVKGFYDIMDGDKLPDSDGPAYITEDITAPCFVLPYVTNCRSVESTLAELQGQSQSSRNF